MARKETLSLRTYKLKIHLRRRAIERRPQFPTSVSDTVCRKRPRTQDDVFEFVVVSLEFDVEAATSDKRLEMKAD